MVSPELETANAVSASLGIPAARHTDVFADGAVQVVEFDVPADADRNAVVGRSLRQAEIPANSKVAGLIRGDRMVDPARRRADPRRRPDRGDRLPGGGPGVEPRGGGRCLARRGRRGVRRRADGDDDRRRAAGAGDPRPRRRLRARPRGGDRRDAAGRACVPRRGVRPRVPRARADRPRAGGGVLPQRRREEPLRRAALEGPRGADDDRSGARPDVGRGLRARRRRRDDQPAPGDRRGDGPLRARPADPPDRDARGRPVRDPRPERARRVRAGREAVQRAARDGLGDRRGDPQRERPVSAQLGRAARGRPGDRVRRVAPGVARRAGA